MKMVQAAVKRKSAQKMVLRTNQNVLMKLVMDKMGNVPLESSKGAIAKCPNAQTGPSYHFGVANVVEMMEVASAKV